MDIERLAQIRARLVAAGEPLGHRCHSCGLPVTTGDNEPLCAHAFADIGYLLVALADSREEANDLDQRLRQSEAVIEAARCVYLHLPVHTENAMAVLPLAKVQAICEALAAYDAPDPVPALVIIDGTPVEMLSRLGREFTEELGQLPPWEDDQPDGLPVAERRRMYAAWARKGTFGG